MYSQDRVPFDKMADRDRAALYYSFYLVDMIRSLSALGMAWITRTSTPSGQTVDTIWRPGEVRTALEHEFRQPLPLLVTSGLE
jgi:hypothetical protein